jgi:urate oxidase
MTIRLGPNQYGKAETHMLRVTKGGPFGSVHEIKDINVSVALAGDFAGSHLTGDNSNIVTTDTQKNTIFAFAKDEPIGEIEQFALRLARHFAHDFPAVQRSRVSIEEHPWSRIEVNGQPHPHSFVRAGTEKRLATVTCAGDAEHVVAGLSDLVLLKSTGSEFFGYPRDQYTTLAETHDRVLATAVVARWRYGQPSVDWAEAFVATRKQLIETFASKHSLALQQTLYAMGEAALTARPEIAEIRLSMQNKHHYSVDLAPFGMDNQNEVFYASDRPYGLIEGTVTRADDSADAAW